MLPAAYLAQLRALVIDDMPSMRSALRESLAEGQIRDVHAASSAEAAIELIRANRFGLVLCDFNLGEGTDGQQLLEHLRAHGLLPPDAIFFIVTGEASQDRVACAGEVEPDGFIVKPASTGMLLSRVEEALTRQSELRPLRDALASRNWPRAITLTQQMGAGGSRFPLRLLRVRAQALGELGRWDEALDIYRSVQSSRDLHWAAFGIARCLSVMGDTAAAQTQLTGLLAARPYHSPANELLITLLERDGDLSAAVDAAVVAARIIPTAQRNRRLLDLALRDGRLELAEQTAARLVRSTARSITRDVADIGMLAEAHLALGAPQSALDAVARLKNETDPRAAGIRAAIEFQAHAASGNDAAAQRARVALELELGVDHDARSGLMMAKAGLAAALNEPVLALLTRITPEGVAGTAVRAQAHDLLRDAGLDSGPASPDADRARDAVREIGEAVELLRAGNYAQAQALALSAEAAAPQNTRVLQEAADIYLVSMRMLGLDEALLARCSTVIDRLRARGTADATRVAKMTTFLQRLQHVERET